MQPYGCLNSNMDIYSAIGDQRRRKIIEQLSTVEAARDGVAIKTLTEGTGITRQAMTKHLNILIKNKIVIAEFVGKERRHFLNAEQLVPLIEWLTPIAEQWEHRFAALKATLRAKD